MKAMEVSVNGKLIRTYASDLHALLRERGLLFNRALGCALNHTFVPRHHWSRQSLHAGDRVELLPPRAVV